MLLSHDQIFNLVAHCLDDLEIPIFLNSYQSIKIKSSNPRVPVQSFLDCVPPFVHPEITHLFGMEKYTCLGSCSLCFLFNAIWEELPYVSIISQCVGQSCWSSLSHCWKVEHRIFPRGEDKGSTSKLADRSWNQGFEKKRVKKSKNPLL